MKNGIFLQTSLTNCRNLSVRYTHTHPPSAMSTNSATTSSVQNGEREIPVSCPLCKDCLYMHILLGNYQAAIWRCCLVSEPVVPDSKGFEWTIDDDGSLSTEWMRGAPAPEAVLQLMSCKCIRACKLPHYVCLVNQLKCTSMCRLQLCTNLTTDDGEVEVEVV